MFENIGMAVATGGILFGAANVNKKFNLDDTPQEQADEIDELVSGVYGALFMTTLHILLGESTTL